MYEGHHPTEEERQFFRDIVDFVRCHPEKFADEGAALDHEYRTQVLRDAKAKEHRKIRRDPNYMRTSRAFKRKPKNKDYDKLARDFGFRVKPEEVEPPPPRRRKDQDGKPYPEIPLIERFGLAFDDTFDDDRSLDVLPAEKCQRVATRRVLMAWVRLDPDRGTVKRITDFQDLRNEIRTLNFDDNERPDFDRILWVEGDGSLERDAPEWIAKARDALETLRAFSHDAASVAEDEASKQAGEPDATGYVENPADASAYIPLVDIVNKHTPKEVSITDKEIITILEDYEDNRIRWMRPAGKDGRPRQNRRNVHLSDWLAYVEQRYAGVLAGHNEDWPVVSEDEIEDRKDAVRRQKLTGK